MKIPFFKYQGTGNDFVMIDNRATQFLDRSNTKEIERICNRRFGIGSDGLILLQNKPNYDFEMVYFNSDGRESSMCGNGGRCIAAFSKKVGIVEEYCKFWAIDGEHEAYIRDNDWVELKMTDVGNIEIGSDYFILDTGSPHYVVFVEDLDDFNIVESAQMIRYSQRFKEEGINVNFVEKNNDNLLIATYERGVEDETLSCGTGVTAAALSWHLRNSNNMANQVDIKAKGGNLSVRFEKNGNGGFNNIWLCGKAELVFEGTIDIH